MTKPRGPGWLGKSNLTPALRLALITLVVCGIAFPLLVTAVAQTLFPYQADGELVKLDGRAVGSNLLAQQFTRPIFFQPRNNSASGVDPDITLENALSQAERVSNATGIPLAQLDRLVYENVQGRFLIFGSPYVNVLKLNLLLIQSYPEIYGKYG